MRRVHFERSARIFLFQDDDFLATRPKGTPFEPDYDFLDPKLDRFYDWMLATFRQRNFSNGGLCHILRALIFEAHLKLPGYRSFAALDRAYAHSLSARCNGYALNTLRSALHYVKGTPAERIDINRGYLANLTARELAEERKLTAQVLAFLSRCASAVGASPNSPRASKTRGLRSRATSKRRYRS